MTSSSIERHISSAKIPSFVEAGIYEVAAKGISCTDEKIDIESTNIITQILNDSVVSPLPALDMIKQAKEGGINKATAEKAEKLFSAIGFVPKKTMGPRLDQERAELAQRTTNLLQSTFKDQLRALVLYLISVKGFTKEEACQNVLGYQFGGSLSDAIGRIAIAVFDRETEAFRAEIATARQEKAEAEKTIARERVRAIGYAGVRRIMDKLDAGYHFPKGYHFP